MKARPNGRNRRKGSVPVDGHGMTLQQVEAIADGAVAKLTPSARRAVRESRRIVDAIVKSGRQVYGVNTGFGHLSGVRIADDQLERLQLNLIRSHAAGVGEPLSPRVVRAILALRANCLARGNSGLRLTTLQRILDFLDSDISPVVPEHGSVGASGDLAPLAHIALVVVGEGEVFHRGRRMPAARALRASRLEPLTLGAKEGLALINGTQVMTGIGILAIRAADRLAVVADIAGAMSLEALLGSHRAFDRRIHRARPHTGQTRSAANLRRLLAHSELERSHRDCDRVQDCYSLRCMAQVHGAARDALDYVRRILAIEVNSSTDNPMVFADKGEMVSGGNFHGQPVSVALDHLSVAIASLASISERRLERLVNPEHSGLPAFLAQDPGLDSGFMLAQVTAAAMVSEIKRLAHPASVDTIPTSANKEDHVSMGVHAARKAADAVDHLKTVLAIELMCAAQALDLRRPLRPGAGAEAARKVVRRAVPRLREDRILSGDIERLRVLLGTSALQVAAQKAVGPLNGADRA